MIDKTFGHIGTTPRESKMARRANARNMKNFVVLTLRKLSVRMSSKLNARKLRDIMTSNQRKGHVPAKRFFWENDALNTPQYHPHNPKARRAQHRYISGLVDMCIEPCATCGSKKDSPCPEPLVS